ncbi:hypothetical protein PhCBS80983_g05681 [Powellomyces hirtus]|uniref:Alpha-ketoglutarate-dependent dioxygenase AlkB-like domain-containing protein n=1 Tax=Powellomyces hirtus TaxID=109895 RepID=A0A507DTZ3_9FUNG|nr:hypothetical protein PhCBS80983_g05681 [Powellomyces hirtus]
MTDVANDVPICPSTRSQGGKAQKLARKREEQLAIFARSENGRVGDLVSNVEAGERPTELILILNAGSTGDVGGVTVADLERVFSECEGFLRIEMVLGKPYSYAVFDDPENACTAYNALKHTSIPMPHSNSKQLMLTFAKQISPEVALCRPVEIATAVSGLFLLPKFVSEEYEGAILSSLESSQEGTPWIPLNKRRVQHYGYRFDYELNTVDLNTATVDPLPSWCTQLLAKYQGAFPDNSTPDQLTVNEYQPGAGIAPHTDTHSAFEDAIIAVSLKGGVVMEFRCPVGSETEDVSTDGTTTSKRLVFNVYLPPRSLLVISGEARYDLGAVWNTALPAKHHTFMDVNALSQLDLRTLSAPRDEGAEEEAASVVGV